MEFRHLRCADPTVQAVAEERAIDWYETDGPATGDSPEEHEARIAWANRIAADAAKTFDKSKIGAGPFGINVERVNEIENRLRRRIAAKDLPVIRGRRLTYKRLATVYLIYVNNIARGNIGEVPVSSIMGLLKSIALSIATSMIAAATRLLIRIGLIKMTRNYHRPAEGGRGQCCSFLLGHRAILPEWCEHAITEEMKVQPVPEVTGGGNDAADAAKHAFPPSLKITIWKYTPYPIWIWKYTPYPPPSSK